MDSAKVTRSSSSETVFQPLESLHLEKESASYLPQLKLTHCAFLEGVNTHPAY